jgi:MFS family permease
MRDLWLVATSLFTWGAGEGMFFFFQNIYLQNHFGASPVEIGAIVGAASLVVMVIYIPTGHLAGRIGARPLLTSCWMVGITAIGIMAFAESLTVFLVGMVMYALTAAVNVPLNLYVTNARGNWSVSRALSVTQGLYALGAVAGPFIGGLIADRWGIQQVYQFALCFVCLSGIIIFFIRSQPPHPREKGAFQRDLLGNQRFYIFLGLMFCSLFILYLPQPLTPNYLKTTHGLQFIEVGIVGTIANLGNALIMLTLGGLKPLLGLFAGQLLMMVAAVLFWKGNGLEIFAPAYFVQGGFRLFRMMMLAYSRHFYVPSLTNMAYAIMETTTGLALVLAPLIAGILYNQNPHLMYIVCVAGIGITISLNLFILPRLKKAQ